MNKRDFFIGAMKAGRLGEKSWLLSAFSVVAPKAVDQGGGDWQTPYSTNPFDIVYMPAQGNEGVVGEITFSMPDPSSELTLSDYAFDSHNPQAPYSLKEKVVVTKDDLPNLQEKSVETTYGRLVANWLLLIYPFGTKIPYINRQFAIGEIEKLIERRLTSNPKDGEQEDPDKIYIYEYNKYRKAAGILNGLTQLCVPSATPKSLTRHPDAEKLRAELLEKYKDRLHDPATIAKIEGELIKLDREWLEGDEAMGFLIKSKSIEVVRKKSFYMVGAESSFGEAGENTLIERALSEGWDIEKLPQMANNLREGSFDRGAQTALGGEGTKFILRVMQNSQIEEEDCGTKHGFPVTITEDNKNQYIGNNLIVNGKVVAITEENVKGFLNKPQIMRSPMFCKTDRAGFCSTCMGARYGASPTGLATAASRIGSTFMSVFMASMHGKALSVAKYDYKASIT